MRRAKDYRLMARDVLRHNIFSTEWLMLLVAILIVSAILSVASSFFVAVFLLIGPLGYGLAKFSLNFYRSNGENKDLVTVFSGFNRFSDTLVTGLLYYLYIFLWSLLFIIPGIIKSYAYSMTYYIMQDNETISGNDAITASRKMMYGHKWELFILDLTFIGWYLVGSLCFGVGVLWVSAYNECARVAFYEDLKNQPQVA